MFKLPQKIWVDKEAWYKWKRNLIGGEQCWITTPNHYSNPEEDLELYVKPISTCKHANEMKDILTKVLNAGTWFRSALEIDPYEQSYDGEELERMIRNVLNKIEREEND